MYGIVSAHSFVIWLILWAYCTGLDDYHPSIYPIYDQSSLIFTYHFGIHTSTLTNRERFVSSLFSLPKLYGMEYIKFSVRFSFSETLSQERCFWSSKLISNIIWMYDTKISPGVPLIWRIFSDVTFMYDSDHGILFLSLSSSLTCQPMKCYVYWVVILKGVCNIAYLLVSVWVVSCMFNQML